MVLPARDFTPGTRDFHSSDLERLGLTDSTFGKILTALEEGPEAFDPGRRDILLVQYFGLGEYLLDLGVIGLDDRIDTERLQEVTIDYIAERQRRVRYDHNLN